MKQENLLGIDISSKEAVVKARRSGHQWTSFFIVPASFLNNLVGRFIDRLIMRCDLEITKCLTLITLMVDVNPLS